MNEPKNLRTKKPLLRKQTMTCYANVFLMELVKQVIVLFLIAMIPINSYKTLHRSFFPRKLFSTIPTPSSPNSAILNIYSTPLTELTQLLGGWNQPKYRAKQIHHWIYEKGAVDFDDMKELSLDLRNKLKQYFTFGSM